MCGPYGLWKDPDNLKKEWEKVSKSISHYDVHIYFNEGTLEGFEARQLAEALTRAFPDVTSEIYDVPVVGPHTKPNVEVVIDKKALGEIMQFLQINRGELSVLVHPRTGDEQADHHRSALWLGEKVEMSKIFFDAWNAKHGNRPPKHG
ncbi:MAG: hypothetical protein GC185_08330 [Alphaproteobacteria bacterium]|nr:hypothetical protein [Alphaproteobacteria bacterium]